MITEKSECSGQVALRDEIARLEMAVRALKMNNGKRENHLTLFLNAPSYTLSKHLVPIEQLIGGEEFPSDYSSSYIGGFHPISTRMELEDDDSHFLPEHGYQSIRANHFVLIYGESEALSNSDGWGDCVLCVANHKGNLTLTMFAFRDDV